MAYAEKLVKSWRACYQGPGGRIVKESGFPTKTKALTHARDQESRIREGRWHDPRAGDVLFADYAADWYDALDLDMSSMDTYRYVLEHHLLPEWGEWRMRGLATAGTRIQAWLKRLRDDGYAEATIDLARGRLAQMLTDAAADGIIATNPLQRPRSRRGRQADRPAAQETAVEKPWASPYEVLLTAERAALYTGRDEDFTRIVTLGWTGMRWSESSGLEAADLWGAQINVQWQLKQYRGGHARKRPKGGLVREIDCPPFLDELLGILADARPGVGSDPCPCLGNLPEEYAHPAGAHVFTGQHAPHAPYTTFAGEVLGAAAEGRVRPRGKTGRPVRVEEGEHAELVGVPRRKARRGERVWAPVVEGLTLHGLRHSHATWMDTAGVPEKLRKERLGHRDPGVHAGYIHVAPESRKALCDELTRLWLGALEERRALSPHSSVQVLDMLLGREEADHPQDHSRSAPDRRRSGPRKQRRRLRSVA